MRNSWTVGLLAAATLSFAVGCGGEEEKKASGGGAEPKGKIAVLLPDSASSDRWEKDDRKFFEQAFKKAGVEYIINNAEGDAQQQQTQAEQAITNGAKVLLMVNLDSGSGATIAANAKSQDVKVIDYDRLTLKGDSDYYVSFDNEKVGKLQGQGLVDCLKAASGTPNVAVLNGAPTDNNAKLFKNGYDSVITPKFEAGEWNKVADQSVPDWDNQQALTIFEQMLEKSNNKIDGVVAANDGLANSVISALNSRDIKNVPVTGQDATAEGVQHVLAGEQCMTVYKAIKKEADAAAALAISLVKGEQPKGVTDKIDNGKREVPSVFLEPVTVTKDNVADTVIKDGFRTKEEICVGRFARFCQGL